MFYLNIKLICTAKEESLRYKITEKNTKKN